MLEYAVSRLTHLQFSPSFCFNSNIIKATVNDDSTLDVSGSLTKSQKNFSSASSSSNNNAPRSPRSPGQPRRREVTEEEAERSAVLSSAHMFALELFFYVIISVQMFDWPLDISDFSKMAFVCTWLNTFKKNYRYIQQVNHAAIIIQRWYRRHANRKRANENTIKHLLTSKKKVMYFTQEGL